MSVPSSHEVTALLQAWSAGDEAALEKLTPLVYEELRRAAHRYMAGERTGHTLQTTAVPNENSVWRAGGFSVRTVTRRAARVANLRTGPENLRTSEHRCSGCRRNGRLNILSTYPIFRLLVVRSDGAVHPLGKRPQPARSVEVNLGRSSANVEAHRFDGAEPGFPAGGQFVNG